MSLIRTGILSSQKSEVRSNPLASAREDLRRNFCAAANFKYQRGYRESELRSQELQELQNRRARSLSENPGPAPPWGIFAKLPDSLAPELLTPEFRNVLGGRAQVPWKYWSAEFLSS